jgi:hypothetical protein
MAWKLALLCFIVSTVVDAAEHGRHCEGDGTCSAEEVSVSLLQSRFEMKATDVGVGKAALLGVWAAPTDGSGSGTGTTGTGTTGTGPDGPPACAQTCVVAEDKPPTCAQAKQFVAAGGCAGTCDDGEKKDILAYVCPTPKKKKGPYKRVGAGYCDWHYADGGKVGVAACYAKCAAESNCKTFTYGAVLGCRYSKCGSYPGPGACPADHQCPIATSHSVSDKYEIQA